VEDLVADLSTLGILSRPSGDDPVIASATDVGR
jgi:hypothetical protein